MVNTPSFNGNKIFKWLCNPLWSGLNLNSAVCAKSSRNLSAPPCQWRASAQKKAPPTRLFLFSPKAAALGSGSIAANEVYTRHDYCSTENFSQRGRSLSLINTKGLYRLNKALTLMLFILFHFLNARYGLLKWLLEKFCPSSINSIISISCIFPAQSLLNPNFNNSLTLSSLCSHHLPIALSSLLSSAAWIPRATIIP